MIKFGLLVLCSLSVGIQAFASAAANVMHPEIVLLDSQGQNVLNSGAPVSSMKTCGSCHDAEYIERSSSHALVGWQELVNSGSTAYSHAWDFGIGLFGRWDPAFYWLPTSGSNLADTETLSLWTQNYGIQHVGGGPTRRLDVEMNCFLCHVDSADNEARITALKAGDYKWSNSATLMSAGVIRKTEEKYEWLPEAFTSEGAVKRDSLRIGDPSNAACGFCHGYVHSGDLSLQVSLDSGEHRLTEYTGSIYSLQTLHDSALNLKNKDALTRSWDIHAERLLKCTSCHYSLNNPMYMAESETTKPKHLKFDGRKMAINEYIHRPMHQFAKGQSSYHQLQPEFKAGMRRCESCHDVQVTHEWLPSKQRHFDKLSCESCHIPYNYFTAREQIDWTVIHTDGKPLMTYRNVKERVCNPHAYFEGFTPLLLERRDLDGTARLAPYNLVSSWYWVSGEPEVPVSVENLRKTYLLGEAHHPMIFAVFDSDGDGTLSDKELRMDSEKKLNLIKQRLEQLGLQSPRIRAEVQAYGIHHGVAAKEWATKECTICHTADSRLRGGIEVAAYTPGGVLPDEIQGINVEFKGAMTKGSSGEITVRQDLSDVTAADYYVMGASRVKRVNQIGMWVILSVVAGALIHGGIRLIAARLRKEQA